MQFFQIVLVLHIIAGSLALLSGPFAMFYQDGGRIHRFSGKTFFRAMMMVALSGFIMSMMKSNLFLLMIAVFSFYMTYSGYRSLHLKQLHRGTKASALDWTALVVCTLFGLGLMLYGVMTLATSSFGIVSIVFGFVLFRITLRDYRRFTKDNGDRKTWLYVHIGNMMGAYIAAFTAFLVQNVHSDPAFISWLAPSALLTPLIIFTIRKFRKGKPAPAKLNLAEG